MTFSLLPPFLSARLPGAAARRGCPARLPGALDELEAAVDLPAMHRPAVLRSGGETGIRTLETGYRLHTFQACAFDHSATSPSLTIYNEPGHGFKPAQACGCEFAVTERVLSNLL